MHRIEIALIKFLKQAVITYPIGIQYFNKIINYRRSDLR